MSEIADRIFTNDIATGYDRAFSSLRSNSAVSDYVDALATEFDVGSDPSTLPPAEKQAFAQHMSTVRDILAAKKGPLLDQKVRTVLEADPSFYSRLMVSGPVAEDGHEYGLTREQQATFAEFGVLPPFRFERLPRSHLDQVEQVLDAMLSSDGSALQKMDRRLNANYSYLFSSELLELAMSKDIVAKVEGVLGDNITFIGTSGPMYKMPKLGAANITQWHSADARGFGGGTKHNLDIVTVWVALSEASVENGCMTILPKSFPLNIVKEELVPHELFRENVNYPDKNVGTLLANLRSLDFGIDSSVVEKVVCRRLNFHHTPKLYYVDNSSGFKKYSPFQSSVDQTMCLGVDNLVDFTRLNPLSLLADKGQFYMFTSQNSHASYPNDSERWRKAIAMRYVRTGQATQSTAIDSEFYLTEYVKAFPKCLDQLHRLGKEISDFREAVPRILVKGEIPKGQERFYIDLDQLRESLQRDNAYFTAAG